MKILLYMVELATGKRVQGRLDLLFKDVCKGNMDIERWEDVRNNRTY